MKKVLFVCVFLCCSASVMAIGFPVNNAYVHQRMEQSKSLQAKSQLVEQKMVVGVVSPVESEPIEIKPTQTTFIQWIGATVIQFLARLLPFSS
ncbi:MAG: hypothetical protein ACK4LB_12035 [Spirosomataceae bacterium]